MDAQLFAPPNLLAGGWPVMALLALAATLGATVWRLRQQTASLPRGTYSVYGAWLRGLIYLCASAVLAVLTGVIGRVVAQPPVSAANLADPLWWSLTALCGAVEVIAYFVIWRKGTLPRGRVRHIPSVLVFGALWGISEALVFLSIWALAEIVIPIRWGVALAAFAVISTFKGIWQSRYWDLYVAPEHNIPAWNLPKVLFAHIPNLIVTLTHLALFESAVLFILFQMIALMGSAWFMRFPAWTEIKARRKEVG
ncbi:MAG TPA: hypothetical protein PKY66_17340 [Thermoflexales bacterium]|nr:hypothetical protein [Thermoflexales bacterium]HQY26906.1 hypothetical protein [Thermoflexales bacterium]HRA54863.1 hypothetical protein [Thermoflexales bacterium]